MKKEKRYWPDGHSDQTFFDAKNGDENAKKIVIEAFTPLVHMWAHEYIFLCQPHMYEDLVQEGIIGILKAIDTFDTDRRSNGKPIKPSTWVWWKVRAEVQSAAKRLGRYHRNSISSLNKSDELNLEELHVFSHRDSDLLSLDVEKLIIDGCGSLDSVRAKIIKDKFGLMGAIPMKHRDVAKKHGVSKQTANTQVVKFGNIIRSRFPELKEMLS